MPGRYTMQDTACLARVTRQTRFTRQRGATSNHAGFPRNLELQGRPKATTEAGQGSGGLVPGKARGLEDPDLRVGREG